MRKMIEKKIVISINVDFHEQFDNDAQWKPFCEMNANCL